MHSWLFRLFNDLSHTFVQPSAYDVLEDGLSFGQFRVEGVQDLLKDVVCGGAEFSIRVSNEVKEPTQ